MAAAPGPAGQPGPSVPARPAPLREIRLNPPPLFDGSRKNFNNFFQAVLLYIGMNDHLYPTDERKIGFTLSYMAEKEAARWREAWVRDNQTAGTITYPAWAVFIGELKRDFQLIDEVGDVMHKLQALQQESRTTEELNIEWQLLTGKAGINNAGDTALIDLYQKVLNRPLLDSDNVPTTIATWKERAIKLDNNYRQKMAILGKTRDNRGATNTNTRG
jgi:hypothetical protein